MDHDGVRLVTDAASISVSEAFQRVFDKSWPYIAQVPRAESDTDPGASELDV
jgi:hypothetical protein